MGAETVRVRARQTENLQSCDSRKLRRFDGRSVGEMGCGCFLLSILVSIHTLTLLQQRDSLRHLWNRTSRWKSSRGVCMVQRQRRADHHFSLWWWGRLLVCLRHKFSDSGGFTLYQCSSLCTEHHCSALGCSKPTAHRLYFLKQVQLQRLTFNNKL